MKTKTLLIYFVFHITLNFPAFSQWYKQQSGTTVNLNDIVVLDKSTAIAIGDSGVILKTTNSGNTWDII